VGVEVQPSGFYTFIYQKLRDLQGESIYVDHNIKILIIELLEATADLNLLDLLYKLLIESMQSPPAP
jgi:hypothetical protein